MKAYEILLTAVALSADAMAVAVSSGFAANHVKIGSAFLTAAFFGLSQAIMPLIGYYTVPFLSVIFGNGIACFLETFAHFTAFALLTFMGLKMIFEAYSSSRENISDPFALGTLLIMAAATGIDALAAGIVFRSFGLRSGMFAFAIVSIGLTASILSFAGVIIGRQLGKTFGKKFTRCSAAAGGVILICLGIKLLV